MRAIAIALTVLTSVMLTADIIRDSALRQWRDGHAEAGMRLIRLSGRINPYSLDVRLDQVESLFAGYVKHRDVKYLVEAILIGSVMVRDYPGSAQCWAVYSSAQVFAATHGAGGMPLDDALRASSMDPLSVSMIERAMFLLSAKRSDYAMFKDLGVRRSRLTTDRLKMTCELCGKHWLEHK